MEIGKSIGDSIALIEALVADIQAALKVKDGIIADSVELVGLVLADEKVKASLSALIQDIKGK